MLKLILVAVLIGAVAAQYPNSIDSGYGAPGGGLGGGRGGGGGGSGARASSPIESDPNLELENEGANLPSDIVGSDLLERVVDALSRDLAEQEAQGAAARAAASGAYGAPASSGAYGPPSGAYGAPGGGRGGVGGGAGGAGGIGNYGQILLLIPPHGTDPLKARLIANYIQRTSGPYTPRGDNGLGNGYSGNGNRGGY